MKGYPLGIKNITVLILLSILLLGCNQKINSISLQNPEEVKKLLQGIWINYEHDWGLVFKGNNVSEYENGDMQDEGKDKYIVDVNSNPIKIIILEEQKEAITYLIKSINAHTLYMEASSYNESVILTKADKLPD